PAPSSLYTRSLHDALPIFEVAADAGAGLAGDAEVEPRWRRVRALGSQHLDIVAVGEHVMQRHHLVIDSRRDAVIADVGVHGVGEDRKSTRLNSSHVKISYA